VITESRAGNDGLGVTVTPGTVAYVTTGGEYIAFDDLKTLCLHFRVYESASNFLFLFTTYYFSIW
jgi:hypothetical protein